LKELEELWNSISSEKIYRGKLSTLYAIWKIIFKKRSLLSNQPLKKIVGENIKLSEFKLEKYDFRFGAVSLISGEYHSFKTSDFNDDESLQQAILASTSIPIVWEPVEKIKTKDGNSYEQLVDGGVRNINPLGDILDENPDEIVIINCNQENSSPDPTSGKNILTIAKRSLTDISINEIFKSDMAEFLKMNMIISQLPQGVEIKKSSGKPYKKYKAIVIQPEDDMGDPLDFSPSMTQLRIKHGYEMAKKVYEGITTKNYAELI